MLRTTFDFYATGEAGGRPDEAGSAMSLLMSCEEWLLVLSDCKLFDEDFTRDSAILCFVWSQGLISDEVTRSERGKHMSYLEFLEALGRVCTMKPLPSAQHLKQTGSRSASDYFRQVEEGAVEHNELLRRPLDWRVDELSSLSLRDPLEMLCSLVVERLLSTEESLTRKELRARLVAQQKQRNARTASARAINAQMNPRANMGGGPNSSGRGTASLPGHV